MGAGGSTPESFFAFQAVQLEYSLLSASEDISKSDLQIHLEALFRTAQAEFFLESPLQCTEPSCILIKMKSFESEDEARRFCKAELSECLAAREKSRPKVQEAQDYSKGFSGTAADTKAEKDFEKMMREGEDVEEDDVFPLLKPPRIQFPEQKEALLSAGSWCRELTASGCYMYCHSLTRAVVSLRPDDFQEELDTSSDRQEEAVADPSHGLLSCRLTDLPATLEAVITSGETKTPLLLDNTSGSQCLTFYSHKARLEDVSGLVVPYSTSGVKRSDVLEKCRLRLVGALKSGSLFVLYLGGVTTEHADFKKKLCKKDCFPAEVFQQRGHKLLAPKSKPRYKQILREQDWEEGAGDAFARDGFEVLVVSTLTPFEFEEKLKDCIPLGYMLPIYVHD